MPLTSFYKKDKQREKQIYSKIKNIKLLRITKKELIFSCLRKPLPLWEGDESDLSEQSENIKYFFK